MIVVNSKNGVIKLWKVSKMDVPEDVVIRAMKILEKGMGMKNPSATRKVANAVIRDAVSIIEKLGGKVIWENNELEG